MEIDWRKRNYGSLEAQQAMHAYMFRTKEQMRAARQAQAKRLAEQKQRIHNEVVLKQQKKQARLK